MAVSSGTLLGPEHVLRTRRPRVWTVRVRPKPKVAILSTGAELIAASDSPVPLRPGQIYNSTGPFLVSALSPGALTRSYHGVVGDKPGDFHRALEQIVEEEPDIVITTGAVSMGKYDLWRLRSLI